MKILPVGAGLFHADGRTDVAKLTVAFRNFANVPKSASIVAKTVRKAVIRPSSKEHKIYASQTYTLTHAHTLIQAKLF
jgi:hypothetical protein